MRAIGHGGVRYGISMLAITVTFAAAPANENTRPQSDRVQRMTVVLVGVRIRQTLAVSLSL